MRIDLLVLSGLLLEEFDFDKRGRTKSTIS